MELHVIDTGFFKLDGGAMFGVVPKVLWKKLNPPDENNLCTWAMRCLLVDTGDRKILIDTGIGDKQSEKFFSHFQPHGEDSLDKSLQKKGYQLSDITDVLLTHLHFDHCGGAVKKDKKGNLSLKFPNATYWTNQDHWGSAVYPNAREKASFLKENIMPIFESGQLKYLRDGEELVPNLSVHFVYGHTNAMMLPHIQVGDQLVIYMADLLPSVGHIRLPYVMAYDMHPMKTLDEKATYLKKALNKNAILFFEHDPVNECCTLMEGPKGIKADKIGRLEELLS